MGKYKSPIMFVLTAKAPLNFDLGWEDYDALYHDVTLTRDMRDTDPCQWPDAYKAEVNARRDEWMRKYEEWLEADEPLA